MTSPKATAQAGPSMAPADVTSDASSPVFLVGATRSGTTLLRLMLNHHPVICNFGEFEYSVRSFDGPNPPALAEYRRQLELDRVFRVHGWSVDNRLDYVPLVRSFLQQAVGKARKPIAGATVHTNFDKLPAIWPNARYVHLVRDPRDVSRSSIAMGWVGNVWYGTEHWIKPIQRWHRLQAKVPESHWIQLRFEDLIQDATAQLTRICSFLGTSYDPAMLDYAQSSTYDLPNPKLVNQWQRKMTPSDIQLVESECHRWMNEFGYETVSDDLSPPGFVSAAALSAQHRLNRIGNNVHRYGLPLYASWQLAKRMPYSDWKKRTLRRIDDIDTSLLK